jgi:beta-N-acetylhexosaminidase
MTNDAISSVGEHFIVGLRPTAQLHDRDRALLSDLRPAGVILFKSNFLHDQPYERWLQSHARLIAEVRSAVGRNRLLIAIDHEGGRVCRTPPPITRFSYAAKWAKQAAGVGRAMGTELASLGINLNFAPVLDIHSNPLNPVIGARAFGSTSDEVAEAALAFMAAMEGERVLACGKHFPGHGNTDKDSHHELPVLQEDLQALIGRELKPFAAAVQAGIPLIMTGHILLPEVDPGAPVTLSRRFNQELLRERLGFGGVVVSDDIGMHAVSRMFEDTAAPAKFLLSGADMMMVCAHWTDTDRCRGFAQAVIAAQENGMLPMDLMRQSKRRIGALLARTPQNAVTELPSHLFEEHRQAGPLFAAETVEVV